MMKKSSVFYLFRYIKDIGGQVECFVPTLPAKLPPDCMQVIITIKSQDVVLAEDSMICFMFPSNIVIRNIPRNR